MTTVEVYHRNLQNAKNKRWEVIKRSIKMNKHEKLDGHCPIQQQIKMCKKW
jgi:hypothetical protein